MATNENRRAVGDNAARQLANTTKTPPQLAAITPRWLVSCSTGSRSKPAPSGSTGQERS